MKGVSFKESRVNKIDFVVTWLDSSDPEWLQRYSYYKRINANGDSSEARFRDWDLFRFWFRSVEVNAPWVNRVYLVTNGTFPKWINKDHPKLVLIKHSDFIPEDYLPTFNSCTIELHMNSIPGLSEHFVYFNDDCYLNAPVTPDYYFRDGLPCDNNSETVLNVPLYDPVSKFYIYMSMLTDIGVLNRHFDRRETVKSSFSKWYGLHLGKSGLATSLFLSMLKAGRFVGFNWRHVEQPYLKSVLDECWAMEPEMLSNSCTRFREEVILNPYFFRYWQFASNKFYPVKLNCYKKIRLVDNCISDIKKALCSKRIKSLCLNDTVQCTDEQFSIIKDFIFEAFMNKFPLKSKYEE